MTKTSTKYINRFLQLKCAPDLMALKLFPNAKEITESFGALNAARKHLRKILDPADSSVILLAVGDGVSPRTAGLFAYLTRWHCISVDPKMREKYDGKINKYNVRRLEVIRSNIEDIEPIYADRALIVAVHSHASLKDSVDKVRAWYKVVISIPCCRNDDLNIKPWLSYQDPNILTPKNQVNIYRIN